MQRLVASIPVESIEVMQFDGLNASYGGGGHEVIDKPIWHKHRFCIFKRSL